MAARARQFGLHFRPHFKTHQAAALGDLFRAEDVTSITVSSLHMARYFARNGWRDITIATFILSVLNHCHSFVQLVKQ